MSARRTPVGNNEHSHERMLSEHLLRGMLLTTQVIQNWIKFLATIQGALAVGFVFVLRPTGPTEHTVPPWLIPPMCFLIPSAAALSALAISAIIVRILQWQAW